MLVFTKGYPVAFASAVGWLFWLCSCSCPRLSYAAVPKISACDCKWPDLTVNTLQTCDSPPKLCSYCMDAVSYMYYGPENSATLGCLVEGRSLDVCTRVGTEIQAHDMMAVLVAASVFAASMNGVPAFSCVRACSLSSSFFRVGWVVVVSFFSFSFRSILE